MKFEKLTLKNVDAYIKYLKIAIQEEPEEMTTDIIDEDKIKRNLEDPFYKHSTSILAILDDKVVGRIEYHFYGCIQNGYRMAYVDWVYVLPQFRHGGVAQALFKEFEKECVVNNINQYYLIRATNDNANHFYGHFENVTLDEEPMLRKYINQ